MRSLRLGRSRPAVRRSLFGILLAHAVFLLYGPGAAVADWSPSATVSESGTRYGFGQDVGPDGTGMVVWSAPLVGEEGYSINARGVGVDGQLGTKLAVSAAAPGAAYTSAYAPAVRYDAAGTATVVWMESTYSNDSCFAGSGEGGEECVVDEYVRARQIDAAGSLSPVRELQHRQTVFPEEGSFGGTSPAYVTYGLPVFAAGPADSLTVLWPESTFGSGCVAYGYSRSYADSGCEADQTVKWVRLSAAGVPHGAAQSVLESHTSGYGSAEPLLRLRAGAAADGTVTVLFSSRRSSAEGECWGGESSVGFFRVEADGDSSAPEELDSGCGVASPDLAVDPGGAVVAVWGWANTYSGDEALYARIDPAGSASAPQTLLDGEEGASVAGLDVARGATGSALAVWAAEGSVRSRSVPFAGALGSTGLVAAPPAGRYFSWPRLAAGPDGSAVVVWESAIEGGRFETALQATALDPDGTPHAPRTLLAPNRWDHGARVSAGPSGSFLASWRVSVPQRNRIQSARFGAEPAASNDAFADAQPLEAELPSFASGSNVGATKEPEEVDHAGDPGGASVWFTWTATESGPVTLATCASEGLDPALALYTGGSLPSLVPVAAAKGGAPRPCSEGDSGVRFDAVAGTTYRIAVDGEDESEGSFGLKLISREDAPANDAFAAAREVSGGLPRYLSGTNIDASRESGEPEHAGGPGGASVWFSWTAPSGGETTISACGSSLSEPLLGVYTGSDLASLTEVGSDVTGDCSSVALEAVAGTTYRIAIDGKGGREGRFQLRFVQTPANDDLANAQALSGLPTFVGGSNVAASKEPEEPDHGGDPGGASVWYSWTPSSSGIVHVSACLFAGKDESALLGVYTGSDYGDLEQVAADAGTGLQSGCFSHYSQVEFEFSAGVQYLIAVDGEDGAESSFSLSLESLPANDDFADAQQIAATPPQFVAGTNRLASREADEPQHDGGPGKASVWYSWTPKSDVTAIVSACLFASKGSTLLGVYTGSGVAGLTAAGTRGPGSESGCFSGTSEVRLKAEAGTTYHLSVDGRNGAEGSFSLSIEALPANDDFVAAEEVEPNPSLSLFGSNRHASKEIGEPNHEGEPGGASVWYRWTPSFDGSAIVSACLFGSRGVLLGVYTGSSLAGLTPVGSPGDHGSQGSCVSGAAAVRLDFTAGTTYYLAVDGKGGEEASFSLRIDPLPSNDDFADAQEILGGAPQFIFGSNVGAGKELGEPAHAGRPGGVSVWYSWTPSSSGPVSIAACSSSNFEPLIAVYTGSELGSLSPVTSAGPGPSSECPNDETRVRFEAQAGITYRIAVDSEGGTQPFTVRLQAPPPNDDLAAATAVEALAQPLSGTNVEASKQVDEPDHAGDPGGASVWYSWTSDRTGPVRVLTCYASFDAVLAVYTGDSVTALDKVNDAAGTGGCFDRDAGVMIDALEGATYRIAVDGVGGAEGGFQLLLHGPALNDEFAAAQPLSGFVSEPGTNFMADKEPGEPDHAGDPGGSSVWYRWTAPGSDRFHLDTCTANVETLLAVYEGEALEDLTPVAADGSGDACPSSPGSRLAFDAIEGTTYYIAVDAKSGAEGLFYLELSPSLNTSIEEGPATMSPDPEPVFAYTSNRTYEVDHFECSLDSAPFSPCPFGSIVYGELEDGTHTLRVRSVTFEGEIDATPAVWTWTIDTVAPETDLLTGPSGTVSSRSAAFTYDGDPAEDVDHFECSLDAGAFVVCSALKASYSSLADGAHTFRVRAVDAAGNADATAATRTWTVDTTPPDTLIDDGPSKTVASSSASFTYSGAPLSDLDRFECSLDFGVFAACPAAGKGYADLPDGTHTFEVRAFDAVGNGDQTPAVRTWIVDTMPPVTSFESLPADPSAEPRPLVDFSADEPATFECALDDAAFAPCSPPLQLDELGDGSHTFRVRATDAVGNVAEPLEHTWVVDTTPPQTDLIDGPEGTVPDSSASIHFDADEPARFECSLDGGGFGECSSPRSYSALADGEHTFEVRAIDEAGNVDGSPAVRTWIVDTTPPDTQIDSGPSGTITDAAASFAYSGSPGDDVDRFECALDDGSFAACPPSGIGYSSLADGLRTFRVRAIDAVGNVDDSPAERSFRVESKPPETTIASGPNGLTGDVSPSFAFVSNESGGFECSLDEAPFGACESPHAYADLADGQHRFAVRAVDEGGAVDPTPDVREFTVDTTPPDTSIDAGPSGTIVSSAATFEFSGQPGADTAGFECALDGGAFAPCSSAGKDYHHLPEGDHSFEVRARDAIGNTDPTPATREWTVDFSGDSRAPETTIAVGPSGTSSDATPTFGFASDEEDSSFECALDGQPFSSCESPLQQEPLAEGNHSFAVRATDPAGNTDPTPAIREWKIDLTAPDTEILSGPEEGELLTTRRPSFTYGGAPADDAARFECRLDAGSYSSCPATGIDLPPLQGGPHTFSVRAVDPYGNADASPATRGFVVPPNQAPQASLSLDRDGGIAPLAVAATIGAEDANGDPLSYTLSFGDGTPMRSGSAPPSQPIAHTFSHAGTFQVRLSVSDGDAIAIATETVVVALPEPLAAAAGDDQRGAVGEPVRFDGSASRPGGLIDEYEWDFGDGSSAEGVAPSHTYAEAGTYTAQLTVRSGSETATDAVRVVVGPQVKTGLSIHVTGGGQPLAGATAILVRPDGSRQSASSDGDGVVLLRGAPDGAMTVYVTAPGYRPAAVQATVTDGVGEVDVDLVPGQVGAATLDSKRLTYDEILAAGIDVADPENSHVYEARIHLFFVPDEEPTPPHTPRVLISEDRIWCYCGGGPGGGGGGLTPLTGGFLVAGYRYLPEVIYVEGEPLIQWLVLPMRASWLKEFFEVKMIVQNLTGGLVFAPGAASLNLPAGLSLAPTAARQELRQEVAAIPAGESKTVSWVVRGDVEGEYDLSAEYSSSIDEIEQSVFLRAQTQEPLKVWGASALRTRILVDEKAVRWGPYAFDVEITNVSDVPVYNMQVEMLDREENRPEREALFFYAPFPPQVQGTPEIAAGETWTARYVVFAGLGNEEITRMRVVLERSFVERTGGDVDLKPELGLRSGTSLSVNAGPINYALDDSGAEDEAVLGWAKPEGPVVGYELWMRQALDRGKWEFLREVPAEASGGTTRIPARMRAVGRYYAVGSKRPDGQVDFLHRLGVGPPRYVALGDSFSAGEGVPAFERDTYTDITPEEEEFNNACHRSERGSYSRRLLADPSVAANLMPAEFHACSGAIAADLWDYNGSNDREDPQVSHLNEFTNVVTLTMGGNDIGFGDIAKVCAALDCGGLLPGQAPTSPSWLQLMSEVWTPGKFINNRIKEIFAIGDPCLLPSDVGAQLWCGAQTLKGIKTAFDTLDLDRVAIPSNLENGALHSRLVKGYMAIADEAPNARVIVQLYPQIAAGFTGGACALYGSLPSWLDAGERASIGALVTKLNEKIVGAVAAANTKLRDRGGIEQLETVETESFAGHELCRGSTLNEDSYFNSLVFPGLTGPHSDSMMYSFHPNAKGHIAFAEGLAAALKKDIEAGVSMVQPRQSVNAGTVFVPFGGRDLRATSSWAGSTVTMSLVSPGGTVFDADSDGVRSGTTPTSEWLEVPDPEQGTWIVRLFGDDVPEGGEETQVTAYAETPPPAEPEVTLSSEPVAGEPDTFDLSASGPAGITYEWSFAGGGTATGAEVRHSFPGDQRLWAMAHATAPDGGEGWFTIDLGAPAEDDESPTLVGMPEDKAIEATGPTGAPAEYEVPVAFDDVDGDVPVSCSPPPGTMLGLGMTTVTCTAIDNSGNEVSGSFHILVQDVLPPDTTPPDTEIETGPPAGGTSGPAVAFTYAGTPAADVHHFECKLDAAAFGACPATGMNLSALASGSHTFSVRAIDASGNADGSPASRSFTVDADAPETMIDSGPSGAVATTSPTFTFSSEPGASFQCRLDGGSFSACTSPRSYSGVAQGSHLFEVRALDALNNVDLTPASRSFVITPVEGSPPSTGVSPPNPGAGPSAPPPPPQVGSPKPSRLKCRKGYKKKIVRGKAKCIKTKHRKKRKRS